MAEVIRKKRVDDLAFLEGGEVEATEKIEFGFEGTTYVIDVGQVNAARMRTEFERYIRAARVVSGKARNEQSQLARQQRAWATSRGYQIAARGRVPIEIQKAWWESRQGTEEG